MGEPDSKSKKPNRGTIGWIDLTCENAGEVREFYESVVGWQSDAVPVEDHEDYTITPAGGQSPVAGICHKKGPNADWPGGWMIYINVDNLETSLENCSKLGGEIVSDIRVFAGYGKSCIIRDPSGSMCSLFESI